MSKQTRRARLALEGLERLGPELAARVVAHPVGELADRVEALLAWRSAFERQRLPDPGGLCWPERSLARAILEALTHAEPPPTEGALLFVLDETERYHQFRERAHHAFREMALQRRGREDPGGATLADTDLEVERLVGQVERSAIGARALTRFGVRAVGAGPMQVGWGAPSAASRVLAALCKCGVLSKASSEALGACVRAPRPNATAAGVDAGELREVALALSALEALRDLLDSLGRRRGKSTVGRAWREHLGKLGLRRVTPRAIEGVGLSGELDRMLASEAALLAHARARQLFLARWAERSLASYDARASAPEPHPSGARSGPVIALLDTSGSMRGPSELVAKGVVLQLLSQAFQSERAIVVLSFSGPGDLLEHRLSHDAHGIARALAFLASSFYGGTVLDDAVARALAVVRDESELADADLLLVTDDFFHVSAESIAALAAARARGLRLAGVSCSESVTNLGMLGADPAVSVTEWVDGMD